MGYQTQTNIHVANVWEFCRFSGILLYNKFTQKKRIKEPQCYREVTRATTQFLVPISPLFYRINVKSLQKFIIGKEKKWVFFFQGRISHATSIFHDYHRRELTMFDRKREEVHHNNNKIQDYQYTRLTRFAAKHFCSCFQ